MIENLSSPTDPRHDDAALAALREAVALVGLDEDRVLLDGAVIELHPDLSGRAVLGVRVLLTRDETAEVLRR